MRKTKGIQRRNSEKLYLHRCVTSFLQIRPDKRNKIIIRRVATAANDLEKSSGVRHDSDVAQTKIEGYQ